MLCTFVLIEDRGHCVTSLPTYHDTQPNIPVSMATTCTVVKMWNMKYVLQTSITMIMLCWNVTLELFVAMQVNNAVPYCLINCICSCCLCYYHCHWGNSHFIIKLLTNILYCIFHVYHKNKNKGELINFMHFLCLQVLICRNYRGDIDMAVIDKFMPLLMEREEDGNLTPILQHGDVGFIYIKYNNLYLVSSSKKNANVALVFQFLHRIVQVRAADTTGLLCILCYHEFVPLPLDTWATETKMWT